MKLGIDLHFKSVFEIQQVKQRAVFKRDAKDRNTHSLIRQLILGQQKYCIS